MKTIYILRGMQASGKSTWAKKFVEENEHAYKVSRDDYRTMLSNYTRFNAIDENIVTDMVNHGLKTLLQDDSVEFIVIDEMHLNEERMLEQISYIKKINQDVNIIIKDFPVTLITALKRNAMRERKLEDKVLKNTWRRYEQTLRGICKKIGIDTKFDDEPINAFIFDIDGTLAYANNRKMFDWNAVDTDQCVVPVKIILNTLYQDGYYIIILSGRDGISRELTEKWLDDNNIKYDFLWMREINDNRPDTIIKKELYNKHIKNKFNILGVFDDRHGVCKTWVDEGLYLFNCNQDPMCEFEF